MYASDTSPLWSDVKLPLKGVLLAANLLVWMAAAYEVGATFA
jgi:hypothetical protein